MLRGRRNPSSVVFLAMSSLVLTPAAAHAATAGDVSTEQVLNTSPLWADGQSYHACNVVNVTTSSVNVLMELISSSGSVLATTTTAVAVPAGTSSELENTSAYTGFARCRFTINSAPGNIRANLTIFHSLGSSVFQTYATSEAR